MFTLKTEFLIQTLGLLWIVKTSACIVKFLSFFFSVAQFDAGLSPRQISPTPADDEARER